MNRRTRLALFLALGLVGAVSAAVMFWRAANAVHSAESEVRSESQIRLTNVELRPVANGVEAIAAPAKFRDAELFEGHLYAAGPAGLFSDSAEFRVGELLPPAPLTAMDVAITLQSAKPELWIGTAGEGLLAFDGQRFRHVRPTDASLRGITAVLGLKVGRVLVGTEKQGVLAFDGKELTFLHDSLRNLSVTALAGDETDLWVGTIDRGVMHWRAGQVTAIDALPDRHVLSLAVSPDGRVFAGTALGVAVIRGGQVERTVAEGLFAQTILATGSRLYVGALEGGVYEIPEAGRRLHTFETRGSVHRLMDVDGRLLAVTDAGVVDVRQNSDVLTARTGVLADANVSALSVDSAGRLWVGYFDRGLDILEPDFSRARHIEDEHVFCVNRILHGGATGAVATANGLVLFDGSGAKRQVLRREDGLIASHVTDVAVDGDEMVAATPAGLSFIGRDGIRSLYAFHGLVNNHTYALAITHGRILAGTLGGLSVLETGAVRASYTTSNSALQHNWITAIATAGPEAFLGTYGAGVVKLSSDGALEAFNDMPKGTEINPGAMTSTATHVYAGTLGKGLLVYRRSDRRWHTVTEGLPSLNVTAVHVSDGRVFAGTDNGLVRLP